MVTSIAGQALNVANPSVAAAIENFELLIGKPDEEQKLGELHPFGKYWVWAGVRDITDEPLRLYERTSADIADLTTDHYSLHLVRAGTWHQIAGLFGYWLLSDADHLWFQVPRADRRSCILLAGGSAGVNRRHSAAWHCQQCDSPLGEPQPLRHGGTPESFVEAQWAAVEAFNADASRRRCASCGAEHPISQGFSGQARNDCGQSDVERVRAAFGEVTPRQGAWNAPVGKLAEIESGRPLLVQIGTRQIALVRDGETVRGISGTCPHYGGPLAQGEVRHGEIVCPWHRFRFDLATGASKTNPALQAPTYEVKISGDDVIVVGVREDSAQQPAMEGNQA